jgi:RNA-binding protein Nova
MALNGTVGSAGKVHFIKLLLPNNLTGSLIGVGGKSIKDMIEVTEARIHVSSSTEPYPGTSDRVVVISGSLGAVGLALNLIWEMIALITSAENPRELEWNPKTMMSYLGQNGHVEVSSKLTIPAAAGGLILGKGGANIQAIAEESGASVMMSSKDDAMFTQERIVSISGSVSSCIKCSLLILKKLDEPAEVIPYVNNGTSYSSQLMQQMGGNPFGMNMGHAGVGVFGPGYLGSSVGVNAGGAGNNRKRGPSGSLNGGNGGRPDPTFPFHQGAGANAVSAPVVAETVITLSVPDELVGNIFGRQGATLREIISLSGAKVNVSNRYAWVTRFHSLFYSFFLVVMLR